MPSQQLYNRLSRTSTSPLSRPTGFRSHLIPVRSASPIEDMWTATFLRRHPNTSKSELAQASEQELMEVYAWLFKTLRKAAQDSLIRLILEQESFMEIHKGWKRVGYPFATLVPSLATAIGSSADRPTALTDLMGILVNEGREIPAVTILQLHLSEGEGTRFETHVALQESIHEQGMPPGRSGSRSRTHRGDGTWNGTRRQRSAAPSEGMASRSVEKPEPGTIAKKCMSQAIG